MTDSLPDRMAELEAVVEDAAEAATRRDALAEHVGGELSDHVETAISEAGTNVDAVQHSEAGDSFRFEARLDRAAMVAALTEQLPAGFFVSHVNDDGTLAIEWTGPDRESSDRDRDAVLKAIVAEETETDSDGLITSVANHGRILDRAEQLGVPRDTAETRLDRLATLDVVDIEKGRVYPDDNFSRI